MSATNRGAKRSERDYYPTPEWAIRAILDALALRRGSSLIDPCCGDGRITRIARDDYGLNTVGWDIRDTGELVHDSLGPDSWPCQADADADVVLTNPPFSHAQEFVERALIECPGAIICMLLPLAFMASKRRAAFHIANPSRVYVLSKRPSFTPDGRTDAQDYGWFAWCAEPGWEVL